MKKTLKFILRTVNPFKTSFKVGLEEKYKFSNTSSPETLDAPILPLVASTSHTKITLCPLKLLLVKDCPN